jgi:hypothetical protein
MLTALLAPSPVLAQAEPASLELRVTSSDGDAEEFVDGSRADPERWPPGYSYVGSSDVELGYDSLHGPQLVGLRFDRVDIPPGARIVEAVLSFTADSNQSGPLSVVVVGNAEPAPGGFRQDRDGAGGFDLSRRPISAAVTWSPEPWTKGGVHRSPDLAPLIQGLVDQPGWQGGGALVLLIRPTGADGEAYRSAYSYDASPERAPRLLVRFEEPRAMAPARAPAAGEVSLDPQAPAQTEAARRVEPAAPEKDLALADSGPRRSRFSLRPNHEHGVRGSVLLSDYGIGGTIVTVLLENASPGTSYRLSINSGGCGSGGGAVTALEPVAGERAFSTSLVSAGFDDLSTGPYHVNVFLESAGFTSVAGCAMLGG